MITRDQIRAARGLLGWTQLDLAANASLSKTAINNIERDLSSPRVSTLEKLQSVFEQHGVEFISEGVRRSHEMFKVERYEGPEAIRRYLIDVVETLKQSGQREVVHSFVDEQPFVDHYRVEAFAYYQAVISAGFRERLLICEGCMMRYGPTSVAQYRYVPVELFNQMSHSVYGNKVCIFLMGERERTLVIESPTIADSFRKQFEANWKFAKPQPLVPALYDQDLKNSQSKE
ncbi:MAG: helix-turn-helix transcriptional regulator [Gammaproteobacteria bacterium]|nr:helix-turn-helix transcriptional regulator [Gammaproteobacteria bacterium]